jgi:hypothetical protein
MAQDVVVQTAEIKLIYTKAEQAKLEMIAEVTEDSAQACGGDCPARWAAGAGTALGQGGCDQINPMHFTGMSWEGNNDQSTADKTMTAAISAEFSLR